MEIMLRKCGSAAVELVTPDKYKSFVKGILEVIFLLWFTYCVSQVESNFFQWHEKLVLLLHLLQSRRDNKKSSKEVVTTDANMKHADSSTHRSDLILQLKF